MKKLIPILFVAIVVILVVYRIATHAQTERVKSIGELQKENGVPVEVEQAKVTMLTKSLTFTGSVKGIKQSNATAKISEKIVDLKVEIGDYVEADEVIAQLDETSPLIGYTQAKLALEDAKRELERMQALHSQGAVSQQILDKTEFGYKIAQANFKQVSEMLEVTAPISGTVTHLFFLEGEAPPPDDPVATIANVKKIRVEMQAAQGYRNELKAGQKAYIYLASHPEIKFAGMVERVSMSANAESRSFTVYVTADNPDNYFQPGVSVETDIIVTSKNESVAVHRDALVKEMGKVYVFIVEEKAKRVEVKIGMESGSMVEILSGVMAGDKVVVNGQNLLADGDPVKLMNEQQY